MLIGSGIQIGTLALGFITAIVALISYLTYSSGILLNFFNVFISLFNLGAFVVLIIACVFVYKEYDAIK
ncbi:hypothetical protein [Sebaldella sp. S0638]|uniref:hypothetical protein n=1 Tax=Sebaldella sp. S0638 TaxID=2957809 RepID=UPI00209FA86F|nr:hypothetical protein [Sebaldella sp. S0638]MCP1224404.1 hypothetical protein [Sebaldella sp. S0638]